VIVERTGYIGSSGRWVARYGLFLEGPRRGNAATAKAMNCLPAVLLLMLDCQR